MYSFEKMRSFEKTRDFEKMYSFETMNENNEFLDRRIKTRF